MKYYIKTNLHSEKTTQVAQISEMMKETIDSGKYGCGIFVDLRKAFDTVNHKILLNKLEHYGITRFSFKQLLSNCRG